jgi:NSS family neurotransmitter:Na+ symporter
MGAVGYFVAFAFFCLMSIAALTSSISMLEAPVSYCVERFKIERKQATVLTGLLIFAISVIIIFNFGELFGLVIAITTQYGQPIIGMLCCIFVGWIWNRSSILEEVKQGNEGVENSLFWKIWPWYTKIVCPLAIAMVFAASL